MKMSFALWAIETYIFCPALERRIGLILTLKIHAQPGLNAH